MRRIESNVLKMLRFMSFWPTRSVMAAVLAVGVGAAPEVTAEPLSADDAGRRLVAAYPQFLSGVESGHLVWKDGTRMKIDDGRGPKSPADALERPDIKDMFTWTYPGGKPAVAPEFEIDPGRVRYQPIFDKMYGDCQKGETSARLANIVWLPKKARQRLQVTRVNGVSERLEAVSRELDDLPAKFDVYLFPSAGTYNCRVIAGTTRPSVHGAGIAIDVAVKHAHYWRWTKPDADGRYRYRNSIPHEIVEVFEKHGFIWGGRWYHYDTMHFEYRPELLGHATDCGGNAKC
ncbi:MAG: M15 family metallopeptidase [Hyphomicrobiaceae bacterium]